MLIKGGSVRVGEGHPTSGKQKKTAECKDSQASLMCTDGTYTEFEINSELLLNQFMKQTGLNYLRSQTLLYYKNSFTSYQLMCQLLTFTYTSNNRAKKGDKKNVSIWL